MAILCLAVLRLWDLCGHPQKLLTLLAIHLGQARHGAPWGNTKGVQPWFNTFHGGLMVVLYMVL